MKDTAITVAGGLLSRDLLQRITNASRSHADRGNTGHTNTGSPHSLVGLEPSDYQLAPGERIGDHIARSWNRLVGVWANFRQAETNHDPTDRTATRLTRQRWLQPLFQELGFAGLIQAQDLLVGGKKYPISHQWGTSVPIHLLGWRIPIDRRTPGIQGAAKKSPHSLVQEVLNRSEQHLWGIVTNGRTLRVLHDNASLTRIAYYEVDLQAIFDGNRYSDFVSLWRTCHRSRFDAPTPERCILEKWNNEATTSGIRALDQLREGVETAIQQLGQGFLTHCANTQLRERIHNRQLPADQYLHQLLRLVYRMLFLLVAESRHLLHPPSTDDTIRCRYHNYYSMHRLRKLSRQHRRTAHNDLWHQLQIIMRALDGNSGGLPQLGLPALGSFLWSADATPDLDYNPDLGQANIDNRYLLDAVRSLCYTDDPQAKALRPVDYRNLGTEELGSVYESLLELHADLNIDARTFKLATAAGSERKTTGSYYTPTSLIDRLLDDALDPILDRAETAPNPETALLGLRVLDPACGSGHFLINAAHRIAGRLATVRAGGIEPDPAQLRTALRDVIGHCVYGIDINPLAAELCKISLWVEANNNGQPLSYLDHHIVCGNSLLGTTPELIADGIPQAAFKALTGDDKTQLAKLRKANRTERKARDQQVLALDWSPDDDIADLAEDMAFVNSTEDTTVDEVAAKADLHNEIQQSETYTRAKQIADAWCAAFVIPKTAQEPAITDGTIRAIVEGHHIPPETSTRIAELTEQYQFLHLHIVFPDIYEAGGFDAVLGNPPWGKIKLQEKQWFAHRSPKIAKASNSATRQKLIQQLKAENHRLYDQFQNAKDQTKRTSALIRKSGRYPLSAYGDINTYQIFAELMHTAGDRVGMIVPSGIATDDQTKHFFNDLVKNQSLVSLYDFENRKKLFPIDSRYRFCLLTLSGKRQLANEAQFVFLAQEVADIDDPEKNFTLTSCDLTLFNPNTRTAPIFRSRRDIEIARKMYRRAGVFWKEKQGNKPEVNPWGITLQSMFHMSNDSGLFQTHEELSEKGWELRGNVFVRHGKRYLPLYEAKLFHQYDHRFATFDGISAAGMKRGKAREMTLAEKANPKTVILPRYWVPEEEVTKRLDKPEKRQRQLSLSQSEHPAIDSLNQLDTSIGGTIDGGGGESTERSIDSQNWLATRSQEDHTVNRRTYGNLHHDTFGRTQRFQYNSPDWLIVFRDISSSTNQRTSIFAAVGRTAVSNKAPLLEIDYANWLQTFRNITNSTNQRTSLTGSVPRSGVGHSASVIDYARSRAIASALVLANMNSLPLDWAARFSVGGVNMNFYIIKQLPILPPEAYLERVRPGLPTYVEMIIPQVLELTYTADDLEGFARDVGYHGPPFLWDEQHRHRLQSELDAIYAHMYGLDRSDMEWILDAQPPSSSFSGLKRKELAEFDEYRTQRYVLSAYDQIASGEMPNLTEKE